MITTKSMITAALGVVGWGMRFARGLVLACHPLPCLAVTAFAAAYAIAVGLGAGRTALLAAAVLAGQLSIGWANDAVDAPKDTVAGRSDKPVAVGLVPRRAVQFAAGLALAACVALSLALGTAPGAVHLVCVAAAWAYDLGLKATPASPLPYLLAFGLLPGVATWALPVAPGWPPLGVLLGAGLLGVGAHFANTVGDADADAATGVRGLPQRIGPRRSLVTTAVAVAVAAVVLGAGLPDRRPVSLVLLTTGALLAAVGASGAGGVLGAAMRPSSGSRAAFHLTLMAVGFVVAGFVLGA